MSRASSTRAEIQEWSVAMEEGFGGAFGALFATVRARQGCLSGLIVLHSKSVLCGAFVWARRALNRPFGRFPARAVDRLVDATALCATAAAGYLVRASIHT